MMMMFSIGVLVCALSVSSSSGKNFIADPKCPAAQPQASCAGRRSTCWSPGVRDLDCPGHGLCCYDGCANTCVPADSSVPAASVHQPQYTPPLPQTTPRPYRPPPTTTKRPTTTTKTPYHPPPVNSYVPPAPKPITYPQDNYIPPLASPSQEYGPPPLPPVQQPSHNIEVVRPRPTTSPPTRPHGNGGGSCPRQTPLPPVSCRGRHSTCWSVGVADLDCPNWGLCCFDGCANTCLDSPPAPRQTTTPQPPRNPCEPNPCGPGSMCIPQEGEPQCKCPEGLVPNPTPAQGCIVPNPCDPNPCGPGSMCIPNEGRPTCKCPEGLVPDPRPELRCSEPRRRDPCNPSPCGPGTTCTPNADGNPICRCKAGLIPKPDTITGCGPECIVDPDCGDRALVCRQERCTERPDPCNPSPCGPGTTCRPNRNGDPVCECEAGLIPKPDTITGCGPECLVDQDCPYKHICNYQKKCEEERDPCDPNPCGEGALCLVQGSSFSCECPTGFVGNGRTGCFRGECVVDDDCSLVTACQNYNCVDPCLSGTCNSADFCRVREHSPICGYNYDPPTTTPRDEFVIGERYNKKKPTNPPNQIVIGARHEQPRPETTARNPFTIGGRDQARMMMMMMDTSRLPVIGASFNRRKRNAAVVSRGGQS